MSTILPEGWIKTSLGTVVDYGKTFKAEPSELADSTWVLELEDIEKSSSQIIKRLTFGERNSRSTKNRFKAGDVLYGKLRPYLEKVVVADDEGVCTTEIVPITGTPFLDNMYIFYWLKHPEFLSYVTEVGYGVNMPRLGTKDGKAAPFVLAPAAEQTRIAQKLDQLLAQVDTLKARVDAVPAILKRFRQSVLAAAVSGKLTEEWRRETPSEWTVSKVVGLCISGFDGPFGSKLKTSDYTNDGARVARLENIGHLKFVEDKKKFISREKYQSLDRNHLQKDDILFSSFVDEEIRVCMLPALSTRFINKADCFCLRVDKEKSVPKFIMYALASLPTYLKIKQSVHGATRPRINLKFLKSFELSVPTLKEQNEIVSRVEMFFAFAGQVETRVERTQKQINHLTQSILAKAFRGELVPQDPNDEPASVLLERIKAARAEENPKNKTKRKKKATR